MNVTAPRFEWVWNLNTIAVLAGFVGLAIGWGMNYQQLQSGREANAESISRMETRISALEGAQRVLENHELRISTVERQASESASTMRAVESSISALSSDLRLTREILERLERSLQERGAP